MTRSHLAGSGRPRTGPAAAHRRRPSLRRTVAVAAVAVLIGGGIGCAAKKGPGPLPPADQLLQEARQRMEKGKYFQARETLNLIVHNPSANQDQLAEAQLLLADAYFFDKGFLNLTEAQGRYQNFVTFHPRHDKIDFAQYQLAMCYFLQVLEPDRDQEQTRKAIEEFRKIERLYPGSVYVGPAREKIVQCFDRIAEHEFLVGRFYMRKKAFPAALERFLLVLGQFPDYSGRDKLYFYLARTYEKMDQPERAREFFELILRDFPDGEYAKEARRAVPSGVDS